VEELGWGGGGEAILTKVAQREKRRGGCSWCSRGLVECWEGKGKASFFEGLLPFVEGLSVGR
jgi:hypothetical protein